MPHTEVTNDNCSAFIRVSGLEFPLRSVSITRSVDVRYEYGTGSHMPLRMMTGVFNGGYGVAIIDVTCLGYEGMDNHEIINMFREPFDVYVSYCVLVSCQIIGVGVDFNSRGYYITLRFRFLNSIVFDSNNSSITASVSVAERVLIRVMRGECNVFS